MNVQTGEETRYVGSFFRFVGDLFLKVTTQQMMTGNLWGSREFSL